MTKLVTTKRHYLNGTWVNDAELRISPLDLAVLRGFGVFDFLTATNGRPFRLTDHLERYERSAAQLGLKIPLSRRQLEDVIFDGIEHSRDVGDLFIRLILTGGVSEDFISPGQPNFMILFHPAVRPSDAAYRDGVKVITYPYSRELAEAKSLNYAAAVIAMQQAKRVGATEAIYVDPETSEVLEGTGSNVFFVSDGRLYTPGQRVLKGVMRKTVIELATGAGITVDESAMTLSGVTTCDECFITSAVKQILPVATINDHNFGPPGPITRSLQQAFAKLVQG